MSKNNYKEFISDFTNYLYAIKNLSELYVKGIVGTVHQFLEFINIYKFDQQFESVEDICLNDIRTLTNNDVYSFAFYFNNLRINFIGSIFATYIATRFFLFPLETGNLNNSQSFTSKEVISLSLTFDFK